MIDIDRFEQIAEELTGELPEVFFKELNGGVNILEYIKIHPKSSPDHPMFIMGEYHYTRETGRGIYIYYGSFMRMYPNAPEDTIRHHLRSTLRHEFRHHLESLAGERMLIDEDNTLFERYLGRD
ncbi:MAG: metallopeptidase family protein [Eubacteriales bacterium]|nr:metallopeptidase family protein [Eubacteriales bacterium]